MLGGLYYPTLSGICGLVFVLARIFYLWYLKPEGSKHPIRTIGAILGDIALIINFILSLLSSIRMMGVY
jgi:hypothetical protein